MKSKLILAGIAAAMLTAPLAARAADLVHPSYKAPAYVAPPFSWSGFYLGVNGGYLWGNSDWTVGPTTFEVAPKGFLAGATLGYNIQTGNWVWGIEGDIDYVNAKGTSDAAICNGCTFEDTWLATVRGRVGYAFGRWLPYLTGGGAFANAKVSSPGGSVSKTQDGWTAGVGLEWAFLEHWSAKVEYLYLDLGNTTCDAATCLLPADASVDFKANILRVGVNYRF